MATYISKPLNSEERNRLIGDFLGLEISQGASITIVPVDESRGRIYHQATITIPDKKPAWAKKLHDTFRDGVMQMLQWNSYFTCTEK